MESRECGVCGEEKVLRDFYYQKKVNRYKTICKKCSNESSKKYSLENKEKTKEYQIEWRKDNLDRVKFLHKRYRDKNKDKIKEINEKYQKNNKEKIAERKKKYRKNNKEKIDKTRKEYCKKNKEKISNNHKEYYKNNKEKIDERNKKYNDNHKEELSKKRKEHNSRPEVRERIRERHRGYDRIRRQDPVIRLGQNISRGMRQSFKFNNLSKNRRHWEDLVGYTLEELKIHLENLFQPGMTWGNQGEWHIDHVIPTSFFKYSSTDDTEFKYCWSLDNLRPLWKKENMSKGNKIIKVVA